MWVQAVTVEWPAQFIEHTTETCPKAQPEKKPADKPPEKLVDENGQHRMF